MNPVKDDLQATGDLADALLSIGEAKLGIQAAISVGYDTQALGLMAVAVALAGVDVALVSHLGIHSSCLAQRGLLAHSAFWSVSPLRSNQ